MCPLLASDAKPIQTLMSYKYWISSIRECTASDKHLVVTLKITWMGVLELDLCPHSNKMHGLGTQQIEKIHK